DRASGTGRRGAVTSFFRAEEIGEHVGGVLPADEFHERKTGGLEQGVERGGLAGFEEVVVGFENDAADRRGPKVVAEAPDDFLFCTFGVDQEHGGGGGQAAFDHVGRRVGGDEKTVVVNEARAGVQGGHAGIAGGVGVER